MNANAGPNTGTLTASELSREFIAFACELGVLRFGEFKTKAGRLSPYFFNAGLFCDGASLARLSDFYARRILGAGYAHAATQRATTSDVERLFGEHRGTVLPGEGLWRWLVTHGWILAPLPSRRPTEQSSVCWGVVCSVVRGVVRVVVRGDREISRGGGGAPQGSTEGAREP